MGAADALQQQPGDLSLAVKLRLGNAQLMFCLQEEAPVIILAEQDQNQPPSHTHLLTLSTSSLSSCGGTHRNMKLQKHGFKSAGTIGRSAAPPGGPGG